MKQLQEFSDNDNLSPSVDIPIKKIEKLPLPYTGNKKKLIYPIYRALIKHKVDFDSVLDAFSGSGSVSLLFKLLGKRVLSNDLLTSSYLNSVAFVENPGIRISEEEKHFLLYNQNSNKNTFVEDNYLGTQFRPKGKECRFNKFTLKECQHLDNFRANIDEMCGLYAQSLGMIANASVIMRLPFGNVDQSNDIMSHRNRQQENYGKDSDSHDRRIGIYYDKEMNLNFDKWFSKYANDFMLGLADTNSDLNAIKVKRASFLANLQQHVLRDCMVQGRMHRGQSLAEINVRLQHQKNQLKGNWSNQGSTEMDFFTQQGPEWQEGKPGQGMKWWSSAPLSGKCLATNMDIISLLKKDFCLVDCAYFDPPYGGSSSDYSTIYRFLEEYVYSEELENLPHISVHKNDFVKKRNYEESFISMLTAAQHIPIWVFSYNDDSWKDIEYICGIIRQFKKDVIIETLTDSYRYLYRKKQGRTKKSSEYLIIAR